MKTMFKTFTSTVSMMEKTCGVNGDDGSFVTDNIVETEYTGIFHKVDAPEDWQAILTAAAENTNGLGAIELGEESEWQWWSNFDNAEQPCETWTLIAQWKEDSDTADHHCTKCGCTIEFGDFDYALKTIDVYLQEKLLGKIYPNTLEDFHACCDDLDNGSCPVCDGWEDGSGNTCSINGWGE